jgi:hypothetical protein
MYLQEQNRLEISALKVVVTGKIENSNYCVIKIRRKIAQFGKG